MDDLSPSWNRFCETQLGDWSGRALVITSQGALVHSGTYSLSTTSVSASRSNPSFRVLALEARVPSEASGATVADAELRYDADQLHVFDDGSYTASHRLLALPFALPNAAPAIPLAVEHVLVLSATERARVFLAYDAGNAFEAAIFLEEAREGLFENRPPLAFTSILGEWKGVAESLQRVYNGEGGRRQQDGRRPFGRGFGTRSSSGKAQRGAAYSGPAPEYSKEDLPPELQHPSRKAENGLMRFRTTVNYGWDPSSSTLRRTTALTDMQGVELGMSTVYGEILAEDGSLFDIVKCSDDSALLTLSNGCWISAPLSRARSVPGTSELGCLVTPSARRRCTRTYGVKGLASETLVTESQGGEPGV